MIPDDKEEKERLTVDYIKETALNKRLGLWNTMHDDGHQTPASAKVSFDEKKNTLLM